MSSATRQAFIHSAILLSVVLVIYWPVYSFEFLNGWDDQWFVTNPYTANGLNWYNLWDIFTHFYYGQYAPVNQLYYTILHSLFGYSPMAFHVASVGLHAANVLIVYRFLLTIAPKIFTDKDSSLRSISFVSTFFFALLPINIESVAWVSASKVLLYALFYLTGLTHYLRYLDSRRAIHYYIALLCFILSFGSKEQAITFPLCLLLLDYFFRRKLNDSILWLEKLPFFTVALLFGLATIQSQGFDQEEKLFYSIYQRIPLVFYTISEYFTKTVAPINLSYLYPFPFERDENPPLWLWVYVVCVPVITYCLRTYLKLGWIRFALLFFLLHLALVTNVTPLARHSVVADRYSYIATIGICIVIGYGLSAAYFKTQWKSRSVGIGIIYACLLIAYSCSHIWVWKNAYTLKKRLKETIEQRADFEELKQQVK